MVLTKRQKEIFDFVKAFFDEKGYSPTFEEIAAHFGFSSKGTVYRHIHTLKKKGVIQLVKNKSRSIHVIDTQQSSTDEIPIQGTLSRKIGIKKQNIPGWIVVSGDFISDKNRYALRILDDSYSDEMILKDDILIIEERKKFGDEGRYLINVDKDEYLIKDYFNDKGIIKLESSNKNMLPLYYEARRIKIKGCVLGIIRQYKSHE